MKACSVYTTGILLLLLTLSGLSLAQTVEIIKVQNRAAEDIAGQIKILYPEQSVHIAGKHQQITVRADDSIINEIKQLVQTFDVPLRQFRISVSSDQNTTHQNQGGSATIHSSGSIKSSKASNTVHVTTSKKTYKTRGAGNQSIIVLEGHSANLNAGQKKPVNTRRLINGQWANTVEYIDMTSGMYVTPRLIGDNQVEVKILAQKNEANKVNNYKRNTSTIDTSTVDTVRIVQLGEWVNVGGTLHNTSNNNNGTSYSTKQHNIDQQSIMIKVDLMP